jgi:surfeit locus 1 family protein
MAETKSPSLPVILFNRRWWWVTLVVIAGVLLMGRLGIWQLDRLEERRAANAELLQQLAQPPFELTGALLGVDPSAYNDREAWAQGEFDEGRQMALLVQNWQGQAGINLITPLILADGTAVLVDRGWIPNRLANPQEWAVFAEPGEVVITGTIQLSQEISRGAAVTPDPSRFQPEWYRIDIPAIAAQLPYDLLPFYLAQAPSPETNNALPYRAERVIDLSEGSHLGYALQWFTFSLMLAVGYIFFVRRQSTLQE